jgi:hypothetical protein
MSNRRVSLLLQTPSEARCRGCQPRWQAEHPAFARTAQSTNWMMPPVLLLCLLISGGSPAANAGGNFTAREAEFVRVAEESRRQSAVYWAGSDLPGAWFRPCPITVRFSSGPAGGSTSFVFDRGEVSGWRMTLAGRREELLADVLPHEVDHMVRASLVRRPIPRWLDEGCAIARESSAGRQRFRARLPLYQQTVIDAAFLDRMDYPDACTEIDRVYAVGMSLVEFLLAHGGPQRLLAFQQDERAPSRKLGDYYGLTLGELNRDWQLWLAERGNAPESHGESPSQSEAISPTFATDASLPTLTIYTSESCGPCRRFWNDLETQPSFRTQLTSQTRMHRIDINASPQAATDAGVREVPTFVLKGRTVTGYEGADWLLRELGLSQPPNTDVPAFIPAVTTPAAPVSQALSHESPSPAAKTKVSRGGKLVDAALRVAPVALTTLELLGIIGGSAATGGVGGIALALALALVRRRLAKRRGSRTQSPSTSNRPATGGAAGPPAPFPRELDEAGELVALRQSEGRVAVLDALRGMFLDDELEKLTTSNDASARTIAQQLREAIDRRVDAVAPLSTRYATRIDEESG